MPTVDDLQNLIDLRHQQLTLLLELTSQQETAISDAHMNELMRILGEKQRVIESFVQTSKQLKADRETFAQSPAISETHRSRNEECNQMHRQLLQREEACQGSLEASRDEVAQELTRGDGAKRAAAGYDQVSQPSRPQGGGLDLSSDA
jgi:DNA gyrase/topoisomerase IV subunit A